MKRFIFPYWKFYVAGGALYTRTQLKKDLSKTREFEAILDKCYRAISHKNEKEAIIHYAKLVWFYLRPGNTHSRDIRNEFEKANLNTYDLKFFTNKFSKCIKYRGEFYHTLTSPFYGKSSNMKEELINP